MLGAWAGRAGTQYPDILSQPLGTGAGTRKLHHGCLGRRVPAWPVSCPSARETPSPGTWLCAGAAAANCCTGDGAGCDSRTGKAALSAPADVSAAMRRGCWTPASQDHTHLQQVCEAGFCLIGATNRQWLVNTGRSCFSSGSAESRGADVQGTTGGPAPGPQQMPPTTLLSLPRPLPPSGQQPEFWE